MSSVPQVVSASNPLPGLWLKVDMLRSASSPGTLGLRTLILTTPETGQGNQTVNTELRQVYSADDVKTAAGRCLGYHTFKALFAKDPEAQVDLLVATESAGSAATGTLTFGGAPTSDETWRVWIHGFQIDIPWLVGESTTQIRDKAFPLINQYADDLFVVASASTAGIVTLTARSKGPAGNDITLRVQRVAGAGGTCTPSAAHLSGGTTEPDFSTAITTMALKEYDYIVPCVSNADAQSASTSNPSRVSASILANSSGLGAKLQQMVVGSTGSIASAKTGAIARNDVAGEHITATSAEALPCVLAGAEAGDRARRRRVEYNANRIGSRLTGVAGSADPVGDQPTTPEAIDALNNGVTVCGYDAQNNLVVIRPITTHSQDSSGNPDRRCFDVNEVDACYEVAKDLRTALPVEFMSPDGGQLKIVRDRLSDGTDDETPEGVIEERDVRGFIVDRLSGFWVRKGVIDGAALAAAVTAGTLQVKVNDSDPTQVDIFIPLKIIKVLAKMGVYVAKVG